MPEFDRFTLAVVDDDYDQRHASNGCSRYGTYLAARVVKANSDGLLETAAEFAAFAWTVATAPTMAPGYVRTRPDLLAVTATPNDDDPNDLVLRITAPVPHQALAARPGSARWLDWESDCCQRGPWSPKVEPIPGPRPVLTLTAEILLPVPAGELPIPAGEWFLSPTAMRRAELTDAAKLVVTLLAEHVNTYGGPTVAALLGGTR